MVIVDNEKGSAAYFLMFVVLAILSALVVISASPTLETITQTVAGGPPLGWRVIRELVVKPSTKKQERLIPILSQHRSGKPCNQPPR